MPARDGSRGYPCRAEPQYGRIADADIRAEGGWRKSRVECLILRFCGRWWGGGAAGDIAPINIGFLSNITFDKGFVEFFGVLHRLKQIGVEYRAHIAGPLAPEARTTFERLLGAASDVQYAGPVYGIDKERFYGSLDIFLFPTNYANEAEPLVIYEAMRRGVYVIACDRGAISEMLLNGAGLALARDDMVESAATHIAKFSRDRRALAYSRDMSLQQAQRIRISGKMQLDGLLACIQKGFSEENCADLV